VLFDNGPIDCCDATLLAIVFIPERKCTQPPGQGGQQGQQDKPGQLTQKPGQGGQQGGQGQNKT
jgi:hypothetical protein